MLKTKNKRLLIGAVAAIATLTMAAAVITATPTSDAIVDGSHVGYYMTIDKGSKFSNGIVQESTINGNTINFITSGEKLPDGFISLETNGKFWNQTVIHGISSITVTFDGSLTLSAYDGTYQSRQDEDRGAVIVKSEPLVSGSTFHFDFYGDFFELKATNDTKIDSITLTYTCINEFKTPEEVAKIEIAPNDLSLNTGDLKTLSYNIWPEDAAPTTLTWSSDDPTVASVDQSGVITGIGKGSTIIRLTAANGVSGQCRVTVYDLPYIPDPGEGEIATGNFDYSAAGEETKGELLASLEKYALDNFTAGIPLYDDASYEQFSARIELPSTTYLTNYGFGTAYGEIDPDGVMYNATINESVDAWKSYFHGYTTVDSGTFNGWDSNGSDVSDRMSMIASGYFGVQANASNTDYSWVGSLSTTDAPIMITGLQGSEVQNPAEDQTSQFWRVKVHFGEGYTYRTADTSKWKSKYDGRQVALEDYLTPFKAMLNGRLLRYADMVSDASGFQGAMEYVYNSELQSGAWEDSGVGIQINEKEGAIDFAFIQPQSSAYARTALSSMFYSPVPEEFITDIGGGNFATGAKTYGARSSTDKYNCFDNILVFGPYIPEYWENQVRIVYKANDTYFEKDLYHYDGYTEDIFTGSDADTLAYKAFLNNQLDEVSIPVDELTVHRNDKNVLRTEGSTIIKLNINSTTNEQWEAFFGESGSVTTTAKNNYWDVKPIMSNEYFLNGFYYAMNREELAALSGRNAAIGYLSDAMVLNPNTMESFRSTKWGQKAIEERQQVAGNEQAYSRSVAETYFDAAGTQLLAEGSYRNGDTIEITGYFRYQTTIDNLGSYIKSYLEEAWNAVNVNKNGKNLPLKVNLLVGGTTYEDTYTRMDQGQFDFAEGAITPSNIFNPIDYMSKCSSTTSISQGFNLNWGDPTDEINNDHPAVFDGKKWSYDALVSVARGCTFVDDGEIKAVADNQQMSLDSANSRIHWQATYPATATDDYGNSVIKFEIRDLAIMGGPTATPTSGYYLNDKSAYSINIDLNGYINIYVDFDEVKSIVNKMRAYETVNYFSLYFSLTYSIDLSKIDLDNTSQSSNAVITKSIVVNAVAKCDDFGL